MKPHKHAELIKAWADGAEIQVKNDDGVWRDAEPLWSEHKEYRIKPAGIRTRDHNPDTTEMIEPDLLNQTCCECGCSGGYALYCVDCWSKANKWVGLTDEEREDMWQSHIKPLWGDMKGINPTLFARAIEAKLREKNT